MYIFPPFFLFPAFSDTSFIITGSIKKKIFRNTLITKREPRSISIPYWMGAGEGTLPPRMRKKAEVLNAFFASVFNSQTGYAQGIQPPDLEDRNGDQNKTPTIQEESAVRANRGGPRRLEAYQCDAHLQEGSEGVSQELQAFQPDLDAGQDYAAVCLECAHCTCERQLEGSERQVPRWARLLAESR